VLSFAIIFLEYIAINQFLPQLIILFHAHFNKPERNSGCHSHEIKGTDYDENAYPAVFAIH